MKLVPTSARPILLHEFHESDLAGHRGADQTFNMLKERFYWPEMRTDVQAYCDGCEKCAKAKARTARPWTALQPNLPPTQPFTHYTTDFIFGLPKAGPLQHDGIMVVVDQFSKHLTAIPVHEAAPAEAAAEAFYHEIVCRRGTPLQITHDRDSRFQSKGFWRRLWVLNRTALKYTTAYTPQADGQSERANRLLEEILRTNVQPDQMNWLELLPGAVAGDGGHLLPQAGARDRRFQLLQGLLRVSRRPRDNLSHGVSTCTADSLQLARSS